MWLLAWRPLALLLASGSLIYFILKGVGWRSQSFPTTGALVNNLGLSLADAISVRTIFPNTHSKDAEKSYRDFHLVLEEIEPRKVVRRKL